MADMKEQTGEQVPEPRGFGEHARGLTGEYAHEQGWGLNEEERTAQPEGRQDTFGGTEYNYGARDFGDEPHNMSSEDGAAADRLQKDVEQALVGSAQDSGVPSTEDKQTKEQR